jgi:hypothetical protein
MKPSANSAGHSWWYRHTWLTMTTCGLLGLSIGVAVGLSVPTTAGGLEWFEWLRPFAVGSATVAGILIGVLAGVLLVRAASGGVECPRCGTLNERGAALCSACDLSFS